MRPGQDVDASIVLTSGVLTTGDKLINIDAQSNAYMSHDVTRSLSNL